MVPIGLVFSKVEEPPENPDRIVDQPWKYVVLRPKWLNDIQGNDKYGAEGNWFWNDEQDVTTFWARFNWLAIRNPANNLDKTFTFYEAKDVDMTNAEWIGNPKVEDDTPTEGVLLSWVGKYMQFRLVKRLGGKIVHIRIGWKMDLRKKVDSFDPSFMIGVE